MGGVDGVQRREEEENANNAFFLFSPPPPPPKRRRSSMSSNVWIELCDDEFFLDAIVDEADASDRDLCDCAREDEVSLFSLCFFFLRDLCLKRGDVFIEKFLLYNNRTSDPTPNTRRAVAKIHALQKAKGKEEKKIKMKTTSTTAATTTNTKNTNKKKKDRKRFSEGYREQGGLPFERGDCGNHRKCDVWRVKNVFPARV